MASSDFHPHNTLVLCHGNVNRSPACAAVLMRLLGPERVKQAGFLKENRRASKKMRDAMHKRGYNLLDHRSRVISPSDFWWSRIIVIMDNRNEFELKEFCDEHDLPLEERTVVRLSDHSGIEGLKKVPDPAWLPKDSQEFAAVVDLVVACSEALAAAIESGRVKARV
jgi:protein-tyrosine-phosphatase